MQQGKARIIAILDTFTGREGEPANDNENYILKSLWLMMLSEFEARVKDVAEMYIDTLKTKDIADIHVCALVRNFHGDKLGELTLSKIVSFYKKNPADINYRNFTQDRVPKYKKEHIEKLLNYLGIFLSESESTSLDVLSSIASTRDAIAHGDIGVQITRRELENNLSELGNILTMLQAKFS